MGIPFILCLALWLGVPNTSSNSPVGRWKTVDDATGKVKSEVVIWEDAFSAAELNAIEKYGDGLALQKADLSDRRRD